MIVIRTPNGIEKFSNWDTVTSRDDFRVEHNPADADLVQILGYYELNEEQRCSLSTCHTAHKKGYLVGLSDGSEINIGNQCGKKRFEINFDELTREFSNYVIIEECKSAIASGKEKSSRMVRLYQSIKGW